MVVSASSSTSKVCIDGKSEDFAEKIALMGRAGSMHRWANVAFVGSGGGGGGINAQVGRCGFCYYRFIAVPTCM